MPKSAKIQTSLVITIVASLFLGAVGYAAATRLMDYKKVVNETPNIDAPISTPTLVNKTPTTPPTTDETANWKTFENEDFTVNHPSDWKTDDRVSNGYERIKIYKGEYQIEFLLNPGPTGGASCYYTDSAEYKKEGAYKNGQGVVLCDGGGKFKQINANNETFRRVVLPLKDDVIYKNNMYWPINAKSKGELTNSYNMLFFKEGEHAALNITYVSPLKFDQKIIDQMDEILATFRSLN